MRPPLMSSKPVAIIFAAITGWMKGMRQVAKICMFCVAAARPAAHVNVSNCRPHGRSGPERPCQRAMGMNPSTP
ncbi:hypothetical protein SHIRM173S_07334 [Streptomyces hirsutus]